MSLKFHKSPFHATHEEDVADEMCDSVDKELHEALERVAAMPPEEFKEECIKAGYTPLPKEMTIKTSQTISPNQGKSAKEFFAESSREDFLEAQKELNTRSSTRDNFELSLTKNMSDSEIDRVILSKLFQVRKELGLRGGYG